ncbi:MAG TPA: DNA alkylation repair protein [Ohtaekwangia sp.]|uniref:DNA alkylation repair protein n=1 Tax=Ohtaekwangia sp. TaxID=2066019 RepID=UPI002F943680
MAILHAHHAELLAAIQKNSGKASQHTFLDGYLGNSHPRYAIRAPVLRSIAREWMKQHRDLSAKAFAQLLTSLIEGESSTEKCMAGILLDYAADDQRTFDPALFDSWLDHLIGWAEVDTLCTGDYTAHEITAQWKTWKPLLKKFAKSKNIQKRRASLVLGCSPLRKEANPEMAAVIFDNIDLLKSEKEILITKAISWVLRSMVKHHKPLVETYIRANMDTLPKIAIRETQVVLKTGKKTKTANARSTRQ